MTLETIRNARIQLHKLENAIAAELKNGGEISARPGNMACIKRIEWLAARLNDEVCRLKIIPTPSVERRKAG